MLWLCEEDIAKIDVSLKLLEWYRLKDIYKIKSEKNSSLYLTIIFKRSRASFSHLKWRLRLGNMSNVDKLTEDLRRQCEIFGVSI